MILLKNIIADGIDSLFDFDSSGPNGLITQAIASKNGQFLSHQLIEKYTRINFKSSIFLSNHDQEKWWFKHT